MFQRYIPGGLHTEIQIHFIPIKENRFHCNRNIIRCNILVDIQNSFRNDFLLIFCKLLFVSLLEVVCKLFCSADISYGKANCSCNCHKNCQCCQCRNRFPPKQFFFLLSLGVILIPAAKGFFCYVFIVLHQKFPPSPWLPSTPAWRCRANSRFVVLIFP